MVSKKFVVEGMCSLEFNETLEEGVEGVLDGEFSVSPSKKVRFSKGNLQYNSSSNIWRFAEHQWDNISYYEKDKSWKDKFGWGTGNNPMNTSSNEKDYPVFVDWGKNAIINGGNMPDCWRTLTKNEWVYMLDKRKTKSGLRYANAHVGGSEGVVIFPDSWKKSIYRFKEANNLLTSYYVNEISDDDWNIIEAHGAVFIPRTYVGKYWLSPDMLEDKENSVTFPLSHTLGKTPRNEGCAVRLVMDIKNF